MESIRLVSNLVSLFNNNSIIGQIIQGFYPRVPPRLQIVEAPENVIYLPVNTSSRHNITVRPEDQEGRPINFLDEITLHLHLKNINEAYFYYSNKIVGKHESKDSKGLILNG